MTDEELHDIREECHCLFRNENPWLLDNYELFAAFRARFEAIYINWKTSVWLATAYPRILEAEKEGGVWVWDPDDLDKVVERGYCDPDIVELAHEEIEERMEAALELPRFGRLGTISMALSQLENLLGDVSQKVSELEGTPLELRTDIPHLDRYFVWLKAMVGMNVKLEKDCLLYTSPSPRD